MIRRVFVVIHRYLGLSLAVFMVMAGLSGSILAFDPELDALLNPEFFHIDEVGQKPMSPSELAERIEATDPRIWTRYIPLPEKSQKAIIAYVEPRVDPRTGELFGVLYDEVFVNPITGQVKGNRMWGECCQRRNFVPLIFKLHSQLLLPASIGRPICGTIAILWAVMSFIGLYLSLPTAKPILRKWRRAWAFKIGLPYLKMNLHLHRAIGLWFWVISLFVALSGVSLALDQELFRPVVSTFSPIAETVWERRAAEATGEVIVPRVSFDDALALAEEHALSIGLQNRASEISYSDYRGLFKIGFGDWLTAGIGMSTVYVDSSTGAIAGHKVAGSGTAGDILNLASQPLHSGRIVGLAGRIFVFLSGVAVLLLAVTGSLMWWEKRQSRHKGTVE